jgi:hypothetical protein
MALDSSVSLHTKHTEQFEEEYCGKFLLGGLPQGEAREVNLPIHYLKLGISIIKERKRKQA